MELFPRLNLPERNLWIMSEVLNHSENSVLQQTWPVMTWHRVRFCFAVLAPAIWAFISIISTECACHAHRWNRDCTDVVSLERSARFGKHALGFSWIQITAKQKPDFIIIMVYFMLQPISCISASVINSWVWSIDSVSVRYSQLIM